MTYFNLTGMLVVPVVRLKNDWKNAPHAIGDEIC
jgi:hypothetical protein